MEIVIHTSYYVDFLAELNRILEMQLRNKLKPRFSLFVPLFVFEMLYFQKFFHILKLRAITGITF